MHAARFLGASDRRSYQRPQVVTGLAHSRRVMEAIRSGMAMGAFQAWQQVSTMTSKPGQTRRLSWFWRRYSQMFSTGLSSGLQDGSGRRDLLEARLAEVLVVEDVAAPHGRSAAEQAGRLCG